MNESVWWWPLPADGGPVPDYPPVDLSGYLVEDGIRLDPPEKVDPWAGQTIRMVRTEDPDARMARLWNSPELADAIRDLIVSVLRPRMQCARRISAKAARRQRTAERARLRRMHSAYPAKWKRRKR